MKALLASRSFAHFAVDLACGFVALGVFVPGAATQAEAALGVLLYNLLAFATQPLLGALCDRFPRRPWAALGCLAVAAGALLGCFSLGWAAVVVCGLGNALFHPGGGRDALLASPGTLKEGGVFVSTGAVGVALGMFWGTAFPLPRIAGAMAALLGLCALLCWKTPRPSPQEETRIPAASTLPFWWVVGLALASVALRAFVGGAVPMPWKTGLWALAAAAAAFLGKAAGGFLADRTSPRFAGVGALLLSLPLLCLGWAHPLPSLLGLLFFNMTMPVTLGTVADKLPNAPGLAFGLTAQFLIVGTLPLYGVSLGQGQALVLAAAGILISAACVALSSRGRKGKQP